MLAPVRLSRGVPPPLLVSVRRFPPPLGAAAAYLTFGRRRLTHAAHRLIADLSLALLLAVSGLNAAVLAYQTATRWSALGPGLAAVRAACWPGR